MTGEELLTRTPPAGPAARPSHGVTRYPAQPARRGAARARTWWGKSWVRAIEEAAFGESDLRRARTISRSGRIGAISVSADGFVAAVEDPDGLWSVSGRLPALAEEEIDGFCEALEAEAGRVAALLAGDLPHGLVEHAEEAGVELLPYGGEFTTTCTCDSWAEPCVHALALLYQVTWLLEDDPFVLLQLRGLPRPALLARLDERSGLSHSAGAEDLDDPDDPDDPDVEAVVDAAVRAARMVELAEHGEPIDHLV